MSMLKATQLVKRYNNKAVVNGVDLTLESGQIVGLLGPNGAGKTTSFYMLVGLVGSDGGTVMLDGEDISNAPIHRRARKGIGYLPQEASIFRKLTVKQNILAVLELRSTLSRLERLAKLNDLLDEFNISHIRNSLGMSLSGGERRRVEIARALAMEPRFILLDEPFAGVDPISVVDIKRIIRQLRQKNIGILITDHNVRETLDICERAYIVSQGKILFEGAPDAILDNAAVRSAYLGEEFSL